MGKSKNHCLHCHQIFESCRNPVQRYCSQISCQNARKNSWRKQKKKTDVEYRVNQYRANQTWQQSRSDYWRNYRATHPEYVRRNKEQQQRRDLRRKVCKIGDTSHLAKSDVFQEVNLPLMPIKAGFYHLIPFQESHLAKSDALTVKLSVITIT